MLEVGKKKNEHVRNLGRELADASIQGTRKKGVQCQLLANDDIIDA